MTADTITALAQSSPPATVFLAAADMSGTILRQMYPAYQDPARFQVLSMAVQWEDIQRQVKQYRPEALVIEAGVAPGPDHLRDYVMQLVGTVAIVVLPVEWAKFRGLFEGVQTTVRGVHLAPVNWAAVASATYSAVATERARTATASPAASLHQPRELTGPGTTTVVGTRTIAFTSFAGGTGKSTIAEAMAVDLARQHIKTLLCSFNSPAAAVGHMGQGLRFSPNATEWLNRPTVDGFLASLQHPRGLDDLDVLMAPDDPHMLAHANERKLAEPGSIHNLIFAAYSFNYGAILLDLPPFADSMWAVQALLAANVALIVCRPTLHDQFAAIHAYRLLAEQLAAQVRIPPDAVFALLNFTTPDDNISARHFQADITRVIGRFPPVLEALPYIPKLPSLQNQGDSPVLAAGCEEFGKATRSLAAKLVTKPAHLDDRKNGRESTLIGKLLGVTVRLGK
jgi:MinD-like ATPase involved in chromosome partitioning or flagellar assembly